MPSSTIRLTATDGHSFDAYLAGPEGRPKAGLVVIQEIFGVNAHMRDVCDGYARDGYLCVSPALFDRAQQKVELGYTPADIQAGRDIRAKCAWDKVMLDVQAAVDCAASAGKVGTVGYCWGGSIAFLSATRCSGVAAAVGYYGGQIVPFRDEKPACPVMLHFGEKDHGIPLTDVELIKAARPEITYHIYPADHGFNCDHRASFEPVSARIARERTIEFFQRHLA